MQSEATQIVAHATSAVVPGVDAEQVGQMGTQLCIGEALRLDAEHHQCVEQRLGAGIAKAQRRGALPIDFDGAYHLIESVFADGAVVRDGLDVEQTSVGLEADAAKRGQVAQVLADTEIARVVDGGLGTQCPAFLVVLLDARTLVVHVQRGNHALGDHAGAKPPRGAPANAPLEDQLHLTGPADIEVLANHFLEERAPGHRPVQHLGERELRLQDRDVVAVARRPVRRRERMRQPAQPLPQQRIDLLGRQSFAQRLRPRRILAGQDAVIQRLVADPAQGELALEPLVAVDAKLRVVGKVAAKLQEERTEVPIHSVHVELIDHRRGAHQPGVGRARLRIAPPLGAKHRRLLLRFADEQHPFLGLERTADTARPRRPCARPCETSPPVSRAAPQMPPACRTNALLIGSISTLEAKRCPR